MPATKWRMSVRRNAAKGNDGCSGAQGYHSALTEHFDVAILPDPQAGQED
jgi:hypothetical protein